MLFLALGWSWLDVHDQAQNDMANLVIHKGGSMPQN